MKQLEIDTGVTFAFQGCEHINRAVTIERANFNPLTMEEVTVVQTFMQVVVYPLTLINKWKILLLLSILLFQRYRYRSDLNGMHIKHVCVPVRTSVKQIGEAIVTMATSRPKKIGGERAKYQ